jgi:hypothetical protein
MEQRGIVIKILMIVVNNFIGRKDLEDFSKDYGLLI